MSGFRLSCTRAILVVVMIATSMALAFGGGAEEQSKGPTTVTLWRTIDRFTPEERYAVVPYEKSLGVLEEKFNVKFAFTDVPKESGDERLNIMVATGCCSCGGRPERVHQRDIQQLQRRRTRPDDGQRYRRFDIHRYREHGPLEPHPGSGWTPDLPDVGGRRSQRSRRKPTLRPRNDYQVRKRRDGHDRNDRQGSRTGGGDRQLFLYRRRHSAEHLRRGRYHLQYGERFSDFHRSDNQERRGTDSERRQDEIHRHSRCSQDRRHPRCRAAQPDDTRIQGCGHEYLDRCLRYQQQPADPACAHGRRRRTGICGHHGRPQDLCRYHLGQVHGKPALDRGRLREFQATVTRLNYARALELQQKAVEQWQKRGGPYKYNMTRAEIDWSNLPMLSDRGAEFVDPSMISEVRK